MKYEKIRGWRKEVLAREILTLSSYIEFGVLITVMVHRGSPEPIYGGKATLNIWGLAGRLCLHASGFLRGAQY